MILSSLIFAFIIAAGCTVLVPVALLIILGIKRKISGLPLLCGAAAFFLSQIALRMPLLNLLSGQSWYPAFAARFFLYALCLAFSAGLFEESARLGGALILKKRGGCNDMISFGLGHAFCETVVLAGMSHISNVLLCVWIGSGFPALPAGQMEAVFAQLSAVRPADVYWGILERFSSVIFHIFATALVFRGAAKKKIRYYFLAILTHTLFNVLAVLLARFAGIAAAEIVLFAAALAMGWYLIRSKGAFGAAGSAPPAENGPAGAQ